jgi:hypothetical protein
MITLDDLRFIDALTALITHGGRPLAERHTAGARCAQKLERC